MFAPPPLLNITTAPGGGASTGPGVAMHARCETSAMLLAEAQCGEPAATHASVHSVLGIVLSMPVPSALHVPRSSPSQTGAPGVHGGCGASLSTASIAVETLAPNPQAASATTRAQTPATRHHIARTSGYFFFVSPPSQGSPLVVPAPLASSSAD